MESVATKQNKAYDILKDQFSYTNVMQSPKLLKIVISTGVGSVSDKNRLKLIPERLALIAGQQPVKTLSKKSIASFKVREGQLAGFKITLHGARMYNFLDKLINIALPRTKDFRGITSDSVDEMGNLSLGIKEHTIFPETSDEDIKDIFGMNITIVTSSNNKEETIAFMKVLGFPFGNVPKKAK
jgi:large subunit ribosomal protein L5